MRPKHSLSQSFGFAFEGFKTAFLTGRNFRIQISVAILAVLTAVLLRITPAEWVTLILIISMVLILELINTSIETVVDMISPEINPKAKLAKDISAACVLVASIASVFIGLFLFLPKILQ